MALHLLKKSYYEYSEFLQLQTEENVTHYSVYASVIEVLQQKGNRIYLKHKYKHKRFLDLFSLNYPLKQAVWFSPPTAWETGVVSGVNVSIKIL